MRTFCFTVDDNIRAFKELTVNAYHRLLDHPYLAMYHRLHERFGVKVQLNMFYETDGFDLSMMTDRYRREWEENASWLKMSFHSKLENECPYVDADYSEVFDDCKRVHSEICRFASEASLAKTTTVHYCQTTAEGLQALKDNGVTGLLGLFGTDEVPMTSYSVPLSYGDSLRKGNSVFWNGVCVSAIDVILNQIPFDRVLDTISPLIGRNHMKVMIHEQYFYPDYRAYQPDFESKLETTFELLTQNGYISTFFEE